MWKRKRFIQLFMLKLNLCKICGAPSVKPDLWYESPSKEQVEIFIISALIELIEYRYKIRTLTDRKVEILEIDERIFDLNEQNDLLEGKFLIKGIPDLFLPEISIEENFNVYIKYRKCKSCQLIANGGAVVAKVQLRCNRRQMDEINTELNAFFGNYTTAKTQSLLPSEEERLKDGWDLSYYDIRGANILTNHFKYNYSAHIIKTKEVITYNRTKNKNVTRTVFSVRLPEYLIGDIILFEDRPYQIVQISNTSTKMYDFENRTTISKSNELILTLNITNLFTRNQLTKFQVISIDKAISSIQLMNLSTFDYQEISSKDINYDVEESQEIFGFYWNENLYIDQISPFKKNEYQIVLEDDDKAFV